jgi:3-oxoacyl-[acyl-carrier-protein] synthase-3
MNELKCAIVGCGSYLPEKIVTNEELAQRIDTSDQWIFERTGIRQRHIAGSHELTSDLAARAAERALQSAGLNHSEVDLIVVATTTPDDTFPSTATRVQAKLGVTRGAAFDVQAVCSGFVFAIATAHNFIRSGQSRTALVIGAEIYSRILDWEDRSTCVLFGDGAGAVVLRGCTEPPGDGAHASEILSTHLHSDGRFRDILFVDGGPSSTQTVGHLRMLGKEVYRHAVTCLSSVAEEALAAHGFAVSDLDWVVPHQANVRILDSLGKRLGLPPERLVVTVDRHANTSAASIPLALDVAVSDGRLQRGQLVLMEAIGGGLTWGAVIARW